jgi:F0F1-type ATP synthase assembly protein I
MPDHRSTRSAPAGSDLAGIGIQFALTVAVFVFGGIWLDRKLNSSPWFTIACTFAGAGGGMYSMYRRAVAYVREQDGQRRGKSSGTGEKGGGSGT